MSKKIAYWATTGLLGFALIAAGASDLQHAPPVMAGMAHLGYPAYVATILGVWKLLGALAIVVPGQPRLKEWAYAGIAFDLSGAIASHLWSGDGAAQVAAPLLLLAFAVVSWAFRPQGRRLGTVVEPSASKPAAQLGLALAS